MNGYMKKKTDRMLVNHYCTIAKVGGDLHTYIGCTTPRFNQFV